MWRVWYLKHRVREILENKDGVGVVEIILILVVLISLVVIFKSQLTSLVETIFEKITSESSGIARGKTPSMKVSYLWYVWH